MHQIVLQDEIRTRLGLPSGIGIARGDAKTLLIECASIEERDRIFSSIAKLCGIALEMGYIYLTVSILGTRIEHPFKLSVLVGLDEELRSQHTGK
jgi:hypothetical protein